MRFFFMLLCAVCSMAAFPVCLYANEALQNAALGEVISLPAPIKSGGDTILASLEKRYSALGKDFFVGEVSMEQLSTVLWASAGRNRDGNGWVVPTAKGLDPYVTVYVLSDDGIFLYDGDAHTLTKISDDGFIKSRAPYQEFAKNAPYSLAFVSEEEQYASMGNTPLVNGLGFILVGAMTQNAQLAGLGIGVGTRYIAAFDETTLRTGLHLGSRQMPICLLPMISAKPYDPAAPLAE